MELDLVVKPDYIRQVVRHSLTTCLAFNVLGSSLSTYTTLEREILLKDWVRKQKPNFPENRINRDKTGELPEVSLAIIEMITLFLSSKSISKSRIEELKSKYTSVSFLLAFSISVGLFCVKAYILKQEKPNIDAIYKFFIKDKDYYDREIVIAKFISFLVYNLPINGYYSPNYLNRFIQDFNLQDTSFELNANKAVTSTRYTVFPLPRLHYFEDLFFRAFSVLHHCSQCIDRFDITRSKIEYLASADNIGLQDYLGLVGLLITMSEHNYVFIQSTLSSNETIVDRVDNIVKHL